MPEFVEGAADVPRALGLCDSGVALAGRDWAPGARLPALDAGGIGPGPGLRASMSVAGLDDGTVLSPLPARGSRWPEFVESALPEGGGASGKRAEAGGGGGMLPGYGAREPAGSGRRVSWAPDADRAFVPEEVSGPGRDCAGAVPGWFAGVEGARPPVASPPVLRPSGVAYASRRIGVEAGPVPAVARIGGRPAAVARGAVAPTSCRPAPPGASPPAPAGSRPCVSPSTRPSVSCGLCQSKPPNAGRDGVPVPRRVRSPKACQSESSFIRPPGSTISRSTDRPGSSDPPSPTVGGWAGLGGVDGRGGMEARRASVLMRPPFPHVRAVRSCAGPRRSRRCGRQPSGHAYPHGRAGIPARRRRGASSPACVRVTLRVVPGRTGTSPPGRGHLPGTSPYPAVILSGSLRP